MAIPIFVKSCKQSLSQNSIQGKIMHTAEKENICFEVKKTSSSHISSTKFLPSHTLAYLPTLLVFPGVSKFFIKSPGLSECLLGDFRRLFLVIVFNDTLTMQRFLDVSRFLYSRVWQVCP